MFTEVCTHSFYIHSHLCCPKELPKLWFEPYDWLYHYAEQCKWIDLQCICDLLPQNPDKVATTFEEIQLNKLSSDQ